jgi:hypothetical protein
MTKFWLVTATGLCAGSLVAAQAPAPVPAIDVKVIAQVGSAVTGTLGAMSAMAKSGGGEIDFVTITARGRRLATSWSRGTDAASARLEKTEIVDFPTQITNVVNHVARTFQPMSFADLTKREANEHRIATQIKSGEDRFPQTSGIDMPVQSRARAKRFDFVADTQDTGEVRTIAGINARHLLVSVRAWDRTKTFDDDGGWVVMSDLWLGARTPAIDRLVAVQRDYARTIDTGVYDPVFTRVELPDAVSFDPTFPELMTVAARVVAEIDKLDGTVLASRMTFEQARSAKEMVAAARAFQAMEREAGKPVTRDPSGVIHREERIVTMAFEYLSIDYAVTNLDVEIPDGYLRKKK